MKTRMMIAGLMLSMAAQAQVNFGVHAGANLGWLSYNAESSAFDTKPIVGWMAGGDVSLPVKRNLVLTSGVDLTMTGGSYSVMSNFLHEGLLTVAFPKVQSKELGVEVPLRLGWQMKLSDGIRFIPSLGIYGRYRLSGSKGKITTTTDPVTRATATQQWDCNKDFIDLQEQYQHVEAYKKLDWGMTAEARMVVADHYTLSLGYAVGTREHQHQFGLHTNSLRLCIGYSF